MKGTMVVTLGLVYEVREVLRAHGVEPDTVELMVALERLASGEPAASGPSRVAQ